MEPIDHPALRNLEPDETVRVVAVATDASVLVTDRRIAVANGNRLALDIPFERLRRVQFDLERGRPATLVLVPEHPSDEPQVLAIPVDAYNEAAAAIALIGARLYDLG
jgi:hypothetical protein